MRKALIAAGVLFLSSIGAVHAAGPMGEKRGESSAIMDVNAAGETVGEIKDEDGNRRAILVSQGRPIEIGTLGGSESFANAINNAGVVTGAALTAQNAWHAYRYDESQGMRSLGTLGGNSSVGTAINDKGYIAGYADTEQGTFHAFVDNGIGMLDLGTFGGKNSYATAVNNNGMVVGAAQLPNGYRRAFLYKPGSGMIEIPGLGGRISVATAVNDNGIVVGSAETADHKWHAFIYDGKRVTDLGAMMVSGNSFATAINANGDIVGTLKLKDHDAPHTFIYKDGRMRIRAGGNSLYLTKRITDDGQIVGAWYTGHILKAGAVPTEVPEGAARWNPGDWMTFALLVSVLLWAVFKVFEHRRKGFEFRMFSFSF
ncbi:HAF repeat-containing protein [Pseudoduganella sp. UC29_106]|uniref:HAF repeat-containing protein n=1 Tax=Pseudoduganella sp. UC29_106 TaxID=3374553 RepID=UPI0037567E9C